MSRVLFVVVGLAGLAPVVTGCAADRRPPVTPPPQLAGASLLFDDRPGPLYSEDFAFRAEWPAGPRPFDYSESIFFVDFTYDLEGVHGPHQDRTRRYFRSYRTGIGHR